jgi:uncharacterized protein (DUF2132 family)
MSREAGNSSSDSSSDPMHGVTLKMIVTRLEQRYGWQELGRRIKINCFISDPSIASSLKFLRRTPWAREKVETLYLETNWLESDEAAGVANNDHIWNKSP